MSTLVTTASEWEGFSVLKFTFDERPAKLVCPKENANGKWALRTEYFGAFAQVDLALLARGWHLAFIKNDNRWAQEGDLARKAAFVEFVSKEFDLEDKCTPIGLSCGGMYAVMLAARIPERIDVLYLDAPVLNLLSCPCDMGVAQSGLFEEFHGFTGKTRSELLSYRDHPIDQLPILLAHDIPVVLVAGDSDRTVPYCENGAILAREYQDQGGRLWVCVKEGCDHHPHALEDPTPIVNAIETFAAAQ